MPSAVRTMAACMKDAMRPIPLITVMPIEPFPVGFAQRCTDDECDAALIAKYGQCPTCEDPPSVCTCDLDASMPDDWQRLAGRT